MVNEFKNTQMKEALAKIKEKQTREKRVWLNILFLIKTTGILG